MTLTTRLAALALALTSTFALTASRADACGDYGPWRRHAVQAKAPERVTGTVIAFRGMPAVRLAEGRLIIQYPTFKNSGQMLYMTSVSVPADQLRPLQRALSASLAKNETARAGVELEQVGADEWRLVSWNM